MDILFKERGVRLGWKSFQVYRLNAEGVTVPVGEALDREAGLDESDANSVVAGAVGWIAEQIKSTPIVLERTVGDEVEPVETHDLLEMLTGGIEDMSWEDLLDVSVWDICTTEGGSAYWLKVRSGRSRVNGLKYLPARYVEIRKTEDRSSYVYRYSEPGESYADYPPEDIVHLRLAPDPRNPRMGRPPLRPVKRRIAIDNEAEAFTWWLLKNRGVLGLIGRPPASTGKVLPKEVAQETEAHLNQRSTGSNRGKTTVLRAAMELMQLGFSPSEMDLSSLSNSTEERVSSVLGVHPVVIALGAGNQQSRVGVATQELVKDSWVNGVIPKQEALIQQINRQLLPEFEPDGDYALRADRSGVLALQPDMAQEMERWSRGIASGWVPVSDAKAAIGLEVLPGDDVYLRGLNVIPYPIGVPVEVALAAALPPPEDDEPEADDEDEDTDELEEARREAQVRAFVRRAREAQYRHELARLDVLPPESWNGAKEKAEAWR